MSDDPFFCDNCDLELSHNDIETVSQVPQIDPDTFSLNNEIADVHKCRHCGIVIGFEPR